VLGSDNKRLRRQAAVVAAVALVSSACGARVSPYLGASTSAGGGSASGGIQSAGPLGSPASTVPGAATPGAGALTRAAAGPISSGSAGSAAHSSAGVPVAGSGARGGAVATPVAALTPSTFSFDPQQQAAYCTGSAGNTASAPGVTATTITAGNVSGITGAVSDSFTPGSQAVQAVFDAIDRYGGICGRQLRLDVQDDQQSSTSNQADISSLIPQVLAFVGSLSDADNGGVPAMESAGVPDLGPAINVNRSNSSVYWSATGGSVTVRNGQAYVNNAWMRGLQQHGQLPKSMAVLSYNIPISAQAGQEYAAVFQKLGVSICYSNYSIPPAPGTVMGSVVLSMQQRNCGGVFTTMDVVGNADMLQDMHQDGYSPQLVSTTYEGYTPDQIKLAGSSNAQGLDIGLSSVPLDAPVPGVQVYTQEMNTYQPGQPLTEFGLEAWADAELYVYALLKAGRNPTRQSLVSVLNGVTNWSSDGAFGPYTPHDRTSPPCVANVQYEGSAFTETWPSSGLFCSGTLVDVGPAG
jgi:branched-chain amino acid transport system substrate-binding protein